MNFEKHAHTPILLDLPLEPPTECPRYRYIRCTGTAGCRECQAHRLRGRFGDRRRSLHGAGATVIVGIGHAHHAT